MQIARYSMAALALILLAMFVLRPLAKRIQQSPENTSNDPLQALQAPQQMSPEAYQRLANMEQVRQSVSLEPERASKVLREWVDPA